ncbi:hypothetical protein MC885_003610 [Smutsia gigantea]|nr:hypothetical protein MC885_003610 [Smutsia gigantea]
MYPQTSCCWRCLDQHNLLPANQPQLSSETQCAGRKENSLACDDDREPSVQTFADKSKQEALKNDLVEALKRKQQC